MSGESLRHEHEQLLRVARPCDELAVCQDRQPPCKGCKQSEGARTVQTLLRELGKRPLLPILPRAK